jgi:hypothetical protein
MQVAINLEFIQSAKFVTNGLPWETDLSDNYKTWEFTADQFSLAQVICGSKLSGDFAQNVEFLRDRENELSAEAEENYNDHGYYGLSFPHCRSGLFIDQDFSIAWYETTSGTIYAVSFEGNEATLYAVYLPLDRATPQGCHHRHLMYVANGMTEEQYKDWYDNYRDDKEDSYSEQVGFHNSITQLEPMPTLEERRAKWEEREKTRLAAIGEFQDEDEEEEIDYEDEGEDE